MKTPKTDQNMPERDSQPQLPPESVRGFVSLLLIIHLFAIGIGLAAYTSASPVERRLVATLAPYLRTFNFDLTHVFPAVARLHLSHAGPSDIDFTITGTVRLPDKQSADWTLPRKGLRPAIRAQRDQYLANTIGSLTDRESEEQEAILPRTVAAAELRRHSAKSGSFKVTAHFLQEIEDIGGSEVNRRNPEDASFFRDVFEANVLLGPGGVDLLKKAAKGEVAPLTGTTGGAAPQPVNSKE
jgi:hypothetical protein